MKICPHFFIVKQSEKISDLISEENIVVDFTDMEIYIERARFSKLHKMGCENLVILPLYPQYTAPQRRPFVMKYTEL